MILKPDTIQRNLIGEVIDRLETKGFQLIAMKFMRAPKDLLEKHYEEHKTKQFFPGLIDYMSSGPIVCMVWEGVNVIKSVRTIMGATDPLKASPGTIRGDFCLESGRNMIHGSDSKESAQREIKLWFDEEELVDWTPINKNWVYETPKMTKPKEEL